MKFNCQFCEHSTIYYRWLVKHMWDFHSLSPSFAVTCGLSSCVRTFTNEKSFFRHLKAKHETFYLNNMKNYVAKTSDAPILVGNLQDVEDICEDTSNSDEEFCDEYNDIEADSMPLLFDFDSIAADILVELKEKFSVTQNAIGFICEKICSLLRIDREYHKTQIIKSFHEHDQNHVIHGETTVILGCESPFKRSFDRFRNGPVLTNFISYKPEYVAPLEIELGIDCNTGSKDTMQYIPIIKTLERLLSHEDVLGEILEPVSRKDNRLCNFSDGILHQTNPLFSETPNSLQLVFYHDDFQVANPLGNKTQKCKISGFYFMVGNLKAEHRSRLKDIQLALLCKASFVKTYGYKKILDPCIEDIKRLEMYGIKIKFDESSHKFFATLSMLVADNLAAHAIGGYYQNFSTVQRFCRFCNRVKSCISDINCQDMLRSREAYDAQILEVEKNPELSSLYGIKERSVLNQLNYFHITDGCPGDIAHDIFEGFAVDFTSAIVVRFIKDKLLTISIINRKIHEFPYAEVDKNNKPQVLKERPLTQLRFKQTACEMWNLLRLFPLLFGDQINHDNALWKCLIMFLGVVERLCAPSFTEDELCVLESETKNFFKEYLQLFPDSELKPKAHFITHYAMNIRRFGPLIKTLRFESKNGYFKSCMATSRNKINISKSMAIHHQMLMYVHHKEHFYFSSAIETVGLKEVALISVPELFQRQINEKCLILGDSLTEARGIIFQGQKYFSGGAVALSSNDDQFVFGEILTVFISNDIPYLMCNQLDTIHFDEHFNSLCVKRIPDGYYLTRVSDLIDYHPLGIYHLHKQMFIPLHHYIPKL